MTIDVILLALGNMIRPTSLAAVYALLSADQPRRLMIAYVFAGLAFTTAFGLVVLLAFHGVSVNHGTDKARGHRRDRGRRDRPGIRVARADTPHRQSARQRCAAPAEPLGA